MPEKGIGHFVEFEFGKMKVGCSGVVKEMPAMTLVEAEDLADRYREQFGESYITRTLREVWVSTAEEAEENIQRGNSRS